MSLNTPVVAIVFNRPRETARLLKSLAQIKPGLLFVIGDGPRTGKPADSENVKEVRALFHKLPWNCEVRADWSDTNMGCHRRVSSGLTWVFSNVPEAIILEDDCIPDQTFFPFCEELLVRFRDDRRVASICGTNYLPHASPAGDPSYYFSNYNLFWGWATWKRAWDLYDDSMGFMQSPHFTARLRQITGSRRGVFYWKWILQLVREGRRSSWGFRWLLSMWRQNGLCIFPSTSLVENVGLGGNATHTANSAYSLQPCRPMTFPLIHPTDVFAHPAYDLELENSFYSRSFRQRLKWLLVKLQVYVRRK